MSVHARAVTRVGYARRVTSDLLNCAPPPHDARRLPDETVAALRDAGVFRLLVPAELGGTECDPSTLVETLSRLAAVDGSVGWCAMIGATSGLMATYLPEETAREVYSARDVVTCGVFAPMGRIAWEGDVAVASGRWSFASGCEHAGWRMGGVLDGGVPKAVLFRAEETRIVDTWSVAGLRATGSHDLVVEGVKVPRRRVFSFFDRPRHAAPVYRISLFGLLALGVAAVAVGIGEGAMAAFERLAKDKRAPGAKRTLAEREAVQISVAEAYGRLFAAKAGLHAAADRAVSEVRADGLPTLSTRAELRMAACHAVRESVTAVDLVFRAAGASAIHDTSPLSRSFRDVHVAAQHIMVSDTAGAYAAKIHMGLDTEASTL